jgi:hypothetical protein
MLPYLRQPFEHSLIASVDSLLSIPDFRIYEKILVTLTRIRSYTTRTFIIQTRTPKDSIFDYARKGNLIEHKFEGKGIYYDSYKKKTWVGTYVDDVRDLNNGVWIKGEVTLEDAFKDKIEQKTEVKMR